MMFTTIPVQAGDGCVRSCTHHGSHGCSYWCTHSCPHRGSNRCSYRCTNSCAHRCTHGCARRPRMQPPRHPCVLGIAESMSTTPAVPELGSGTPTDTYIFGPWGGGPSQCIYIPPSASTGLKKTYSQLAVAPVRARGVSGSHRISFLPAAMSGHEKQPSAGRWWGVVMAWLMHTAAGSSGSYTSLCLCTCS
jgi:hypothetical protein